MQTQSQAASLVFNDWEPGLTAAKRLRTWMRRQGLPLDPTVSNIKQLARVEAALSVDWKHLPRQLRRFLTRVIQDWKTVLGRRSEREELEYSARLNELSMLETLSADFGIRSVKNLLSWHARWQAGDRLPVAWSCFLLYGLRSCLKRSVPQIRIRRLTDPQINSLRSPDDDDCEQAASSELDGLVEARTWILPWLNRQNLMVQRVVRLRAGLFPARRPWTTRAIAICLGRSPQQIDDVLASVREAVHAAAWVCSVGSSILQEASQDREPLDVPRSIRRV